MCSCQWKIGQCVIKRGLRPVVRGVTNRAGMRVHFCSVIRIRCVRVVLFMAGPTVCRSAGELPVDMALSTIDQDMRPGQGEVGQVVIKRCFCPIVCGVTVRARLRVLSCRMIWIRCL